MTRSHERIEYEKHTLSETDIYKNPFDQFDSWWQDAQRHRILGLDVACLSTVDLHCCPDARVVLIKDYDRRGFVFYTNYESKKAYDLSKNPNASLLIFWQELERQVRIRGIVEKVSRRTSIAYFKSRPEGAQIGAWASTQSKVITSRKELDDQFHIFESKFSVKKLPCPPHWGGMRLRPSYFEFWQGRKNRLHDRLCFSRIDSTWKISRLAP